MQVKPQSLGGDCFSLILSYGIITLKSAVMVQGLNRWEFWQRAQGRSRSEAPRGGGQPGTQHCHYSCCKVSTLCIFSKLVKCDSRHVLSALVGKYPAFSVGHVCTAYGGTMTIKQNSGARYWRIKMTLRLSLESLSTRDGVLRPL